MSPIPKTRNVGKTMRFLKKEKPSMPKKQKVAISLNTAKRAGAKIERPKMKGQFGTSRMTGGAKSRIGGVKTQPQAITRRGTLMSRVEALKTRVGERRTKVKSRITGIKRRTESQRKTRHKKLFGTSKTPRRRLLGRRTV